MSLPSEWRRPARVRVSDDEVVWSRRLGDAVALSHRRDLVDLLDSFVLLGRPPGLRSPVGARDRVRDFVDRYGPWGACSLHPGDLHGPLAEGAGSLLPMPPRRAGSKVIWPDKREPIDELLQSARLVNALRAVSALVKVRAVDVQADGHKATRLMSSLLSDLRVPRAALRSTVEPGRAQAVVDQWLHRWFEGAHVMVTPRADVLSVGGVAGALAVALLVERRGERDGQIHLGLCSACKTTWDQRREWRSAYLLGDEQLCPTCRDTAYAKRWRAQQVERTKKGRSES
jgi:hypothetical protein